METRTIVLNLQPRTTIQAVNVSQYDVGVPLRFIIYDGASPANLSSVTSCKIQMTRPSGMAVTETCQMSGNVVTKSVTLDMTREAGDIEAELRFILGTTNVGTCNFTLSVEPAAQADDAIEADTEALREIAQEIHADVVQNTQSATIASQSASSAQEYASSAQHNAEVATAAATSAGAASSRAVEAARQAALDAQTASQSAQDVVDGVEAAQAAATIATNKATIATNKASEAATSATQASDYASSANTSATSATSAKDAAISAMNSAANSEAAARGAKASAEAYASQASDSADRAEAAAQSLVVDDTLTQQGQAADAYKTGLEITGLKDDLSEKGFSEDARVALLNCFEHVWWTDEHGQGYYNALQSALYPDTGLVRITAVFTQGSAVFYTTTPINDLKAYLVVTGHYSDGTTETINNYSLSGTLEVGTSTITVTKEGKTTTFNVTVQSALDSIAYGTLTYRDIFITNNLFTLGGFENISSLPSTETTLPNGDTYYASYGSPLPEISTEEANTGIHSLKAFSTGSSQMKYSISGSNSPTSVTLLIAYSIDVKRYSGGRCGVQLNFENVEGTALGADVMHNEVTDGFVPEVRVRSFSVTPKANYYISVFAGTWKSGNADVYVDDIVVSEVPDGLTLAEAEQLYDNYIAIRKEEGTV